MFCCKVFFASKKLLMSRVLHLPMYACHFSRLPRWLDLSSCIFYAGDAHYLQVDIRKYGSNSYNRKYLKEQKTK